MRRQALTTPSLRLAGCVGMRIAKGKNNMKLAIAATTIIVTLAYMLPVNAQTASKHTVAKTRAPGTTSDVGNRCSGGSYDSCVRTNVKLGWTMQGAGRHCSRTCAK